MNRAFALLPHCLVAFRVALLPRCLVASLPFVLPFGLAASLPCVVHAASPLAVTVNLNGQTALLQTHIDKGWPLRPLIDARCGPGDLDKMACYYRVRELSPAAGRYVSGSRVQTETFDYPPEAVLISSLPIGSTITHGSRTYPDIRRRDVREQFASALRAELDARPAPMVLVDNIVHPSADNTWPFPWDLTCDLLRRIQSADRKIIANVAGASYGFTDADLETLANSANGAAFEMGFHARARANPAFTRRQIEVYRYLWQQGLTVILLPVDGSLTTEADKDAEARYLAAFAMIVRENPGDPVHVSLPVHKAIPDWADWPEKLGKKRDSYYQEGTTLIQAFEGGILRLTPPRTVTFVPKL
jgi:hypothetical protein